MPCLDGFLNIFGDCEGLHKFLETKARDLIGEWKAKNGSKNMMENRSPIQKIYSRAKYSWMGSKNKREYASYDLQLNTFGYTASVQKLEKPIIRLKDINVFLKLRTSVGLQSGPDLSGTVCIWYICKNIY